ncbi:response regulator receiver domain-containing protein [Thermodesulfovibrio aggregans]|uniref:Response regulator receiver domain-containing protein n=1 Tax=Thermodesulfovibrio aggregans TaxID=86166 RepID=A0A0U9HS55_9BACT|nr:response regulator [Thermodesulfovibrio aggregans]GAQ94978.1 response regulator receiver domain-containing protein [Thermodesulfovibrio aggregans]
MYKIFLLEKSPFLSNYLNEDNFSVLTFSNIDNALESIKEQNPHLIIAGADIEESELLNFFKNIREKHSLLLSVLAVLNFYSSINLEQLKNLGADFIIKPFTKEELKQKVEFLLGKKEQTISPYEDNEFIEKFRPFISKEVKIEIQNIFKQILEVMQQRNA